ncbi:MAG: tetratricopeptide repeat protein [Chloroflexota bacterium]
MAEGEFALVRDYLKAAGSKPLTARGLLFHDNELYALFADLAVQQRDEMALRQYTPLAEETAVRDDHILHQASANRAWGVLHRLQGEYAASEARLNQALALFQGLDTRWQLGRTLYELGELAQARTDPFGARDYFSRALASFKEMKAVPDMARTQAALASLD